MNFWQGQHHHLGWQEPNVIMLISFCAMWQCCKCNICCWAEKLRKYSINFHMISYVSMFLYFSMASPVRVSHLDAGNSKSQGGSRSTKRHLQGPVASMPWPTDDPWWSKHHGGKSWRLSWKLGNANFFFPLGRSYMNLKRKLSDKKWPGRRTGFQSPSLGSSQCNVSIGISLVLHLWQLHALLLVLE